MQEFEDDDLSALDARLAAVGGAGFDDARDFAPPSNRSARRGPAPQSAPPAPPPASELPRGLITDLRSWSSKYRFSPELEYIKIMRTQPAIYRNVNATGWLCDVYNPIDENYLGTVWGGGLYIIAAFQNSGGGPREVARGYVQINGNPRAFRGQDGQPSLFPTDPNEERYAGLPGIAQPQQQQQPQPQQQQQMPMLPLNGAPAAFPAVDLLTLAEKFSGTRQDSKSLEVLRDAQTANAEFYQTALARSAEEQRAFREQLTAAQTGQLAPLQTALENYRAQMESRDRAHAENSKRMVDEHTAQLIALRAQHEKTLDVLRSQQDKTVEETRRTADAAQAALRDEARQREQTIRETARVEADSLRREVDRLRDESRREIDALREQNRRELSEARENSRREIDGVKSDADKREAALREQLRTETTALREGAIRDVAAARTDADRREQQARENAQNMYSGQIKMLESQLQTMREQQDQRLGDVRSMLESQGQATQNNFQLQLTQREAETQRLRDELQAARAEVSQLRSDLAVKSNPMTTMTEVAQLTQSFQAITGTGPQPPAPPEEEPKTILAQLAKYAPAIGQHLIQPTMRPIAEAVQTVREREEREEQLRRDILMRRQAMQQQQQQPRSAQQQQSPQQSQPQPMQEQAGPQHAAMVQQQAVRQQQRLLAQQQQQAQQRAQVHAQAQQRARRVVPQANPAPVLDVPDHVLEEAASGAPALAGEPVVHQPTAPGQPVVVELPVSPELLTYLKEALDSGVAPAAMASNLSMGVMLGVVPQATFDQLKQLPTDVVVQAITMAAEQAGIPALMSPRAMDFLEATHKAILAG